MRNLKRVLSLTLASVMLLGLMVVGTSAVGYSDVDYNKDNVEAIEVTSALGIFEGDEGTSNFRPNSAVTRAEMAKIMAVLLDLNYKSYEGTHPFTDTVGHWAEAYIAACTANGVINGRGGGIYDPAATVTGIEASAMLMRALGYFKYASDVADGFEIATMSQASKIGIFSGIDGSAYEGMPRGDVAQLVLNALQASMVEVSSVGTTITTADGTVVNTGKTTYSVRMVVDNSANNKYNRIGGGSIYGTGSGRGTQYSVELGEELYDGKLELLRNQQDAFGRKGNQWKYNNKEIGTYRTEPDLIYTKSVKGKDIWNDLGRPSITIGTYYTIDGDATVCPTPVHSNYSVSSNGSKDVYYSNKDVVIEVYYDSSNGGRVDLIMYGYYLAQADDDYNADDNSLAITVKAQGYDLASKTSKSFESELDGAKFGITGYKKDDYMIVTAAFDGTDTFEIQSVSPAIVVSGVTVTEYRHGTSITAGGKTYNYGYQVLWDTDVLGTDYMESKGGGGTGSDIKLQDAEYNLYLSPNNYVIGMEAVEGETSLSDYVFVEKADNSGVYAQAKVIYMDGTSAVVTVSKVAQYGKDLKDIETYDKNGNASLAAGTDIAEGQLRQGWFYTYSTDKSGNYRLTSAGTTGWLPGATYMIDPDAADMLRPIVDNLSQHTPGTQTAANAKTVFVTGEKVYTGVENAPKVNAKAGNNIYYLISKDASYLVAVYTATSGSATTSADEWYYIYDGGEYKTGKDADGTQYWMYDAVQGTKTLKGDGALLGSDKLGRSDGLPGLYKVEGYTDGYADLGKVAGSSYFLAKDTGTAYAHANNLVYAYHFENDTYIIYKDGVLNLKTETNGKAATDVNGEYYYLKSDTLVYLVTANDKGQSVSSVREVGRDGLKNLPKNTTDGYDVYLVMEEEDSTVVALAYVIRRGTGS